MVYVQTHKSNIFIIGYLTIFWFAIVKLTQKIILNNNIMAKYFMRKCDPKYLNLQIKY